MLNNKAMGEDNVSAKHSREGGKTRREEQGGGGDRKRCTERKRERCREECADINGSQESTLKEMPIETDQPSKFRQSAVPRPQQVADL